MLAGRNVCAIVDPARDIDVYLEEAASRGLRITHILETHLHADFVSGHIDLSEATGADIYAPAEGKCLFRHIPLAEGDVIEIENMRLCVLETPGHTPEHISYVVVDTLRGVDPVGVFCGDTLFVGDVGRPDLFPETAPDLAEKLFHSLHGKLLKLPDFCEIYPAHGAGSLCGRSVGAKYQSTVGYERKYNKSLLFTDEKEFLRSLTLEMPQAPDHFSRCSNINRLGPVAVSSLQKPVLMTPAHFREKMKQPRVRVIDVRGYDAFGGQHIQGSWNISAAGNFPTFAGWVIPPEEEILLVSESAEQAMDAVKWARRVGIDNVYGYLDHGLFKWALCGFETAHLPQVSSGELHRMISGEKQVTLVDVRAASEFGSNGIKGAINIPVSDLRYRYNELNREAETVLMCSSGHRSSLGGSFLLMHGFKKVMNAAGGMEGYAASGFSGECHSCANPHGSRVSLYEAPDG
jgi:hydroxyacylglutathione hydrolase